MSELTTRRERITNLGGTIAKWMGDVYNDDEVERAICRAAVEIARQKDKARIEALMAMTDRQYGARCELVKEVDRLEARIKELERDQEELARYRAGASKLLDHIEALEAECERLRERETDTYGIMRTLRKAGRMSAWDIWQALDEETKRRLAQEKLR